MARGDELRVFAEDHDLALISIADLIAYRRALREAGARRAGADPDRARRVHRQRLRLAARRHRARRPGPRRHRQPAGTGEDVLVGVHSECLTGDVFGSLRCDCGPQLDAALAAVRRAAVVVLYMRGPRGPRHRPAEQAAGLPAAGGGGRHRGREPALGLPADARDYGIGARRSCATSACGPCGCSPTTRTSGSRPEDTPERDRPRALPVSGEPGEPRYLTTAKRDRMGYDLPDPLNADEVGRPAAAVVDRPGRISLVSGAPSGVAWYRGGAHDGGHRGERRGVS